MEASTLERIARETAKQVYADGTYQQDGLTHKILAALTTATGARESLKPYLLIEKDHQIKTEEIKQLRALLLPELDDGRPDAEPCDCGACQRYDRIEAALKPAQP